MAGIDLLLANALTNQIKQNIDASIEKKLKRRLFTDYGFSIKQTIEDFHKLEKILYEIEGPKTSRILKNSISKLITVKKSKETYTVTLKDEESVILFLKFLGDSESRKIITSTLLHTLLPVEILKVCKLPRTSGYRKLNVLIREGIIIKAGSRISRTRRNIYKYRMFCEKFNISIEHNKLIINATVPKKILEESTLYSLIIASS